MCVRKLTWCAPKLPMASDRYWASPASCCAEGKLFLSAQVGLTLQSSQ